MSSDWRRALPSGSVEGPNPPNVNGDLSVYEPDSEAVNKVRRAVIGGVTVWMLSLTEGTGVGGCGGCVGCAPVAPWSALALFGEL
jgi:hypothetical protein